MQDIIERLLDSEEHAAESAIPAVAEDAVEEITRLRKALESTQTALSQAMQAFTQQRSLITKMAEMHIWAWDRDDGTPYDELDGDEVDYLDSHQALMGLIEDARKIEAAIAANA